MPVCGNYLFFELPKKIVLNPKDGNMKESNKRKESVSQKNQNRQGAQKSQKNEKSENCEH